MTEAEMVQQADVKFGEWVRSARRTRRMSQQHLTDVINGRFGLGWHQTTVTNIESGKRPARIAEALALALVFEALVP